MTPPERIEPIRIIEAGILFLVGFGWMSRLADLSPLLRDWLGIRPGPPQFAVVNPFEPLLRGIVAVSLLVYLLHLLWRSTPRPPSRRLLGSLAWLLIAIGLVTPAMRDMWERGQDEARNTFGTFRSQTDDAGVLQVESAMAALAAGHNPYAVDYAESLMERGRDSKTEDWEAIGYTRNPAFAHLPYPPAAFLVSLPVWWVSETAFGWYDQRLVYLLAALGFVWLCGLLVEPGALRRIVWLLAGASQLLLPFVRMGRNDVLLLLWLAAFAVLLQRRRLLPAAAVLGMACATKQFAWLVALPYAVFVWYEPTLRGRPAKHALLTTAAVFLAFVLPFALWSPHDFFDDVVAYALGFAPEAAAVRPDSIGAASLVHGLGWTNSMRGFPMWALQLALTVPVAASLLARLARAPSPPALLLAAGLILYTALFASAYFDLSFLIVPTALILFAGLLSRPYPGSPGR